MIGRREREGKEGKRWRGGRRNEQGGRGEGGEEDFTHSSADSCEVLLAGHACDGLVVRHPPMDDGTSYMVLPTGHHPALLPKERLHLHRLLPVGEQE